MPQARVLADFVARFDHGDPCLHGKPESVVVCLARDEHVAPEFDECLLVSHIHEQAQPTPRQPHAVHNLVHTFRRGDTNGGHLADALCSLNKLPHRGWFYLVHLHQAVLVRRCAEIKECGKIVEDADVVQRTVSTEKR